MTARSVAITERRDVAGEALLEQRPGLVVEIAAILQARADIDPWQCHAGLGEAVADRVEIPLDRFVTGLFTTALKDGEILAAIRIPKLSAKARWGWWKFTRKAGEFAQAIGAVLQDPERGVWRAVIGAVRGAPLVIADARQCDPATEAAKVCSDPYERQLHAVALKRALAQLEKGR